ncbi:MAG: metallophosphoesterase [Thermoguttaceae bacterium]|jgi:hypothetical protein
MTTEKNGFDRRTFLSALGAFGLLGAVKSATGTARAEEENYPDFSGPVASYPVLQNPGFRGMSVAWAVGPEKGKLATGWVEWGRDENLGQKSHRAVFGLNPLSETFLSARLDGLEPGTIYHYRTATCQVLFENAYKITTEEPVYSRVYKFKTPSQRSESEKFVVINDTHGVQPTLKALITRIAEIDPEQVIWNGDLLDSFDEPRQVVDSIFCPQYGEFAATRPLLFNNGNHDVRGIWAREKSEALLPWKHKGLFDDLGRNFVLRNGPVALIGLDTGEDKPDANPVFAGLANFEPYRERQAAWLGQVLKSKPVRTAPYIIAICHIPLFNSVPGANPGDVMEGFAAWQRPCARLWGPFMKDAGVQLVIAAHEHGFRFDPATDDRPWAQVVGGGPQLELNTTVIIGEANAKRLSLTVEKVSDRSILGQWEFEPRRV